MTFFERKYFILRTVVWTFMLLHAAGLDALTGLQGVPTWICLGINSPFIEFGTQEEQLANTSIPLNITKDEQAYMHQEGLRKLGTFIKPVDLRDSQTGYVRANLTKRLDTPSAQARRIHPIQEEMDQKQIILLDEDTDENGLPASLTDEDRKFIVPMALKNASPPELRLTTSSKTPVISSITSSRSTVSTGLRRRSTTTHTTTTTTPDPTSDIDDLKKHILYLHNMTKSDNNFESKFVKFPSLQKEKAKPSVGSIASVKRPQRPILQYAAPIASPTRKVPLGAHTPGKKPFGGYYQTEEESGGYLNSYEEDLGKIGHKENERFDVVPQVHLLSENHSTTVKNVPIVTPSTITETTTSKRTTKRPVCLRNPDSLKCVRQRQREEQQRQRERDEWFRGQAEFMRPRFEPIVQTINNTKRFAVSIEIPDSFKVHSESVASRDGSELQMFSRVSRSINKDNIDVNRNNQDIVSGGNLANQSEYYTHDLIMTSAGVTNDREFILAHMNQFGIIVSKQEENETIPTTIKYSETINLNPDSCYLINGLTIRQKKLCALHTSVMPAISRGALAAIQECQVQFKNRRWNCSTIDDISVFGPMTAVGSPEMAFIHALAAATVTSFIARACRDGQLTSCGCSRGSRPKQLHDDWTWGGCGDNLEYAYKFATDFIDVPEKETRRGTRGISNTERRGTHQVLQKQKIIINASTKESLESNKDLTVPNNTKHLHLNNSNFSNINSMGSTIKTQLVQKQKETTIRPSITLVSSLSPSKQNIISRSSEPRINPDDLLELQKRITKGIFKTKLKENEMLELQEKINQEILSSKLFYNENGKRTKRKRKNQRAVSGGTPLSDVNVKARSLMNLHNNEAGRRAVIKKTRITCKCHGVSGSCSLITCWQQLSSIREIGDYLREKYEEATEVRLNKRGRLQVKHSEFKVPTAHDLIYLDDSPDWCRTNRLLQWAGTHGRVCNKTSSGLDSCGILCCGRGYNTKNIIVRERCNCKFHWCCQVKCDVCTKVLEEHTCK